VIVDTWMWTPFVMLICLAGLRSIPDSIYEAAECDRASKWRQFWTITVPMVAAVSDAGGAVSRHREFQDVRPGGAVDRGRSRQHHNAHLHRPQARSLRKWRTGYSSAYAVILFVTVFGLASIYVKALNKVKER
jgi:multiple sugar transport system permease protein